MFITFNSIYSSIINGILMTTRISAVFTVTDITWNIFLQCSYPGSVHLIMLMEYWKHIRSVVFPQHSRFIMWLVFFLPSHTLILIGTENAHPAPTNTCTVLKCKMGDTTHKWFRPLTFVHKVWNRQPSPAALL